jgi:hypothetical protein
MRPTVACSSDGAAPPLRPLFVWKEFTHDYERTIHPSDA